MVGIAGRDRSSVDGFRNAGLPQGEHWQGVVADESFVNESKARGPTVDQGAGADDPVTDGDDQEARNHEAFSI